MNGTRSQKTNLTTGQKLYSGFNEIARQSACDYFEQWTYDKPFIITHKTNERLNQIQKLLKKTICYFVDHYHDYKEIFPLSDRINEILDLCWDKPYNIGSYRTDFLIDINNNIKLIEITCRFALNGLFISGYFNLITDKFLEKNPSINKLDEYTRFFDYLMNYFGEFEHICLLKGTVEKNESKYAVPLFNKAGYKVHVIQSDSIKDNLHLFENAVTISELNYEEWCSQPNHVIKKILDSKLINDLRTIFLIHDKRFFSILNNIEFLRCALSENEIKEFQQYIVPSYMSNERPDLWLNAMKNKDNWIIKPCSMGRSINVFAGCTTSEEDWLQIFTNEPLNNYILQSYVDQKRFKGKIKDTEYNDYIVGILLLFNDNFFGPGVFRASSFPITNKVDDRKIAPLVTNDIKDDKSYNII